MVKAARICDALGAYGINYIEDPDSPFSAILGKDEHVDTVRYPRTTLHIRSGDCDDTTALLASLLESSGISTAIMTSPGHVFLAFDTKEPETNKWMFETENLLTIEHNNTLWIPIETTVLSEGFPFAWKSASNIISRNTPEDIDFIPVEKERESFPPLPLGESNLHVVEPTSEQIDHIFISSIEMLNKEVYELSVSRLEHEISTTNNRRNRHLRNKLGILHGRFAKYSKAEEIFKNLINENNSYLSPYLNLGNIYYFKKEFDEAIEILERGYIIKPESLNLNLALAKTYNQLNDRNETERFYNIVQSRSEKLSRQYAYLISDGELARAGINEEPPVIWETGDE